MNSFNPIDSSDGDQITKRAVLPTNIPSAYKKNPSERSVLSEIPKESESQRSLVSFFDFLHHEGDTKIHLDAAFSEAESSQSGNRDFSKHNDLRINIQQLKALSQDFSKMPECVEKNLLTLHYTSKYRQLPPFPYNLPSFNIPETFTKLKERMTIEGLQLPRLKNSLANIEAHFSNEDWKSASETTMKLLKEIRFLNIQEIIRLVHKSQDSVNLAAKQDIVLFLGTTGAGKSTTIHFLAGSEMDQEEGSDHIFAQPPANQGLHKITISASTKSETRYITSVTVNFADIEGSCENGTIILCDAPGRNDTAGAEVDIANSISIQRVIKSSKSVRPVFLMSSQGQGDRLEGIKKLIHFLREMIPQVQDEEIRKSLTFMWTKFPKNKRNEIQKAIKTLIKDMDETQKADKTYVAILQDMLEKTKESELITIDPLEDKRPGLILDKLKGALSIGRPQEVFRFSVSASSREAIREQIFQHKNTIRKALERSEFELIKYKLSEINFLKELIEDEIIQKWLMICGRDIIDHLEKEYKQASSRMNTCMQEENSLSEHEIQEYKEKALELKTLADLVEAYCKYSDENNLRNFDLVRNLEEQIQELLGILKTRYIDDLTLKLTFDKLQLISKYFPQFLESHKKANMVILALLDNACENSSNLFKNNKFQESEAELGKIQQFSLFSNESTEKYQQLKEYLLNNVKSSLSKVETVLKKYFLSLEDIEAIISEISRLESIKKAYARGNHISQEEMESVCKLCADKVQLYFDRLLQNVDKEMDSHSFECLPTIQDSLAQLRLIRNIQLVENRTTESYFQLIGKLRRITQDLSKKITENLDPTNNQKINTLKISSMLRLLSRNQWIDKFEEGLYSRVINNIQEEALKYYSNLKDSLKSLLCGYEASQWIQDASQVIVSVQGMTCFEEVLPELKKERAEIINLFEGRINSYHNSIQQLLQKFSQVSNFSGFEFQESEKLKFERFLLYIKACEGISRVTVTNSQLQENLESFLRKYRNHLSESFPQCFNSIDDYRETLVLGNLEEPDFPIFSIQDDLSASSMSINTGFRIEKVKADVEVLSKCFTFLRDIKDQYPSLSGIFDNQERLATQWKKLIQELCDKIISNLTLFQSTNEIRSLKRMLRLVGLLRPLDDFSPENLFRLLYNEFNKQIPQKTNEKKEEIIRAINTGEYENIPALMEDFMEDSNESSYWSEKKILDGIRTKLRQHVEKLLEETQGAVSSLRIRENITSDKFDSIAKNLKKLRKISDYLSNCLEPQTLQNLKEFEPKMKKDIADRLKGYLESTKLLLDILSFNKANEQRETLGVIIEVLGGFCEEDVQIGFSELDVYEEKKLKELEDKFTDSKFSEYPGNNSPQYVFLKFKECLHTKPAYERVKEKIEQNLLQAFEKKLKEDPNIKVEAVKSYLKYYLPESLAGRFELMLLEFQDRIDDKNALEKALKGKFFEEIKRIESEIWKRYESKNTQFARAQIVFLVKKSSRLAPWEIFNSLNKKF